MFACLPYVRITSLFRNDEQARGDGEKANGYSNACRGSQCLQSRTIPFTHHIRALLSKPRSALRTRSAARAANQTTPGKSLLDRPSAVTVNSRGSAKLHERRLQAVGLGTEGEAAKRGQWQTALLWSSGSWEEPRECPWEAFGKGRSAKLPCNRGRTNVRAMSKHSTVQSKRTTRWLQIAQVITLPTGTLQQQQILEITKLKYFKSGISRKMNRGFNERIEMKSLSISATPLGLMDHTFSV